MHVLQDGFSFERGAVKAGHHALLEHLIELLGGEPFPTLNGGVIDHGGGSLGFGGTWASRRDGSLVPLGCAAPARYARLRSAAQRNEPNKPVNGGILMV
jgi:hypothetical protein